MIHTLAIVLSVLSLPLFGAAQSRSPLEGAEERIQKYRTGPVTIRVVDADGQPVQGVSIRLRQTKSKFLFGAGALSLLKHKDPTVETLYQKRFSGLFNFATVLTYWQDTEPEKGKKNYALIDSQAQWLRDHQILVKGHPMILAGAAPGWAPQDVPFTKEHTKQRIEELAKRYQKTIGVWDVVGDSTTAHNARTGLGAWARAEGAAPLTADATRWARAANPKAMLLYNDYKLDEDFLKLIPDMKKLGSPPDVLGLEAHMGPDYWPHQRLWDICESFGKLGLPLHISEITVPSGDRKGNGPWEVTQVTEAAHADYVAEMYTMLFSHPAVHAIAWWNPVDGDWDTQPGGLIRKDLSPKPAYDRLSALINGKWRTNADLTTDESGAATCRAFLGDYEVTVVTDGMEHKISMTINATSGKAVTVRIP